MKRRVWGGLALGALAMSAPAFAAVTTSTTEYLVRYRQPQNTLTEARENSFGLIGAKSQVELLNSEEGVVKLTFKTEAEAQAAIAKLKASGKVLSVAPNHWYRPAIKYTFRDVEKPVVAENAFLTLPFANFADAGLPAVQLPPTNVTPGADPLAKSDWALKNIHMPSVEDSQAFAAEGAGITAAVIDTGVDYNHEDLRGALWRKPGNPKEIGYDFVHNNAQPYDVVKFDVEGCLKDVSCAMGIDQSKFLVNPGHGTHCAGHVAAVTNNSTGIRGIGTDAKVMGLKFFYDAGETNAGQGDDAAAVKAIDYAIKNGAKVISASWGGRMSPADAEASELKQALIRAQQAGVIVVIAAGNDSIDQESDDTPDYPAAYKLDNLIVVAATDSNDGLADFSNYGAKSVHIGAPGVKILSTTVGNHYDDVVAKYHDQNGAEKSLDWDGTSMATPIVAGAVALVWEKNPSENYHQIRDRILKSARPVAGLSGKTTTGGVLNVSGALGAEDL